MKTKPFHQPEGDYCKDCPYKITQVYTNHAACWSFHKELKLDSEGRFLRVDDCKEEDE